MKKSYFFKDYSYTVEDASESCTLIEDGTYESCEECVHFRNTNQGKFCSAQESFEKYMA